MMARRKLFQKPRQTNRPFSTKVKVVREGSPCFSHYYINFYVLRILNTLSAVLGNFKQDWDEYIFERWQRWGNHTCTHMSTCTGVPRAPEETVQDQASLLKPSGSKEIKSEGAWLVPLAEKMASGIPDRCLLLPSWRTQRRWSSNWNRTNPLNKRQWEVCDFLINSNELQGEQFLPWSIK